MSLGASGNDIKSRGARHSSEVRCVIDGNEDSDGRGVGSDLVSPQQAHTGWLGLARNLPTTLLPIRFSAHSRNITNKILTVLCFLYYLKLNIVLF